MQRDVVGVDGRKYSTTGSDKPKEPEIVQELKSLKERFNLDFNKIEEELRRLKEQDENVSKKMQSAKELQAKDAEMQQLRLDSEINGNNKEIQRPRQAMPNAQTNPNLPQQHHPQIPQYMPVQMFLSIKLDEILISCS